MLRFLDYAALVQNFRRDLVVSSKDIFQGIKTNFDPLLFENVRKAALRQSAMQGHLAAFKSGLRRIAGTGFLALVATARSFAETSAWTAAESLLLVRRTLGWM